MLELTASVLGPQGVRVGFAGRSLTLRWEDMGALCRLRAPGVGTLYLLSAPLPPAGDPGPAMRIAVKASHAAGLEKVVEALAERLGC